MRSKLLSSAAPLSLGFGYESPQQTPSIPPDASAERKLENPSHKVQPKTRHGVIVGSAPPPNKGPPLAPKEAAARAGLSIAAFWRNVASGRLPAPVYPAARSPRWYGPEIEESLERTRMLPCEAKRVRMKRAADRRTAERGCVDPET